MKRLIRYARATAMLKPNEGKTCDAVIRRLEARESCTRSHLCRPEIDWPEFPIELAFALGKEIVAVEHTLIEPFAGHQQMEAQAEQFYTPIKTALANHLGNDSLFQLHIPVNAFSGRKKKRVKKIQNALVEWVKTTARTIPKRPHPDYKANGTGPIEVERVPFTVALYRYQPPIIPGQFFEIRHVVKDLEKERIARLTTAIENKFPKLAQWKHDCGARTVMVLEVIDIQVTNPSLVMDAYLPLVKNRTDTPDETYLVATGFEPWHVWPILFGSRSYADIAQSDPTDHWEFDPARLTALTDR
jgi:hypothetical protein